MKLQKSHPVSALQYPKRKEQINFVCSWMRVTGQVGTGKRYDACRNELSGN